MFHNVVVPSNDYAGLLSLAVVIRMAEGVLPEFLKTVMDRFTKRDQRLLWRAEGMLVFYGIGKQQTRYQLTEKFTFCNSVHMFHSRLLIDGRVRLL